MRLVSGKSHLIQRIVQIFMVVVQEIHIKSHLTIILGHLLILGHLISGG